VSDPLGKRTRLGVAGAVLAAMTLVAPAVQAHPIYDTTRVLDHQGNACLGERDCRQIASKSTAIKAGQSAGISMRCPTAHPYLQGWDARRDEHISISMAERRAVRLTLVATNHADTPGWTTIIIGCSSTPHHPTAFLQSVNAVPSKMLRGR
jgi:hypothetical protein